jgi:hypothetical protein
MFKLVHLHEFKIMFISLFCSSMDKFSITNVYDATITKPQKKFLKLFLHFIFWCMKNISLYFILFLKLFLRYIIIFIITMIQHLFLFYFCYKFMSNYLKMILFLNIKNGDYMIMTSLNYYYYFQFCGVVQMMIIDKKD